MTNEIIEGLMNDPWMNPFYDNDMPKSEKEIAMRTLLTKTYSLGVTEGARGERERILGIMNQAKSVNVKSKHILELVDSLKIIQGLINDLTYTPPTTTGE